EVIGSVVAAGNVMSADNVVVAGVAVDCVGALAADEDVVAVVAVNRVVAAIRHNRGVDRSERERFDSKGERQFRQIDVAADLPEVAEDQVVVVAAGNRVAAGLSEYEIVSSVAVDRVVAAAAEVCGLDECWAAVGKVHLAIVAKDDVVSG